MSEENNKLLKKGTLLILGAGASIGAARFPIENSWHETLAKTRMPSGDNFFHDLFFQGETKTRSKKFLNVLGLFHEGLNDLIVTAWGLEKNLTHFDPEEWRQINIEEVFTFLDIGSRMYPRGTGYQKAFDVGRSSLVSFITTLLWVKSDGFHCDHLKQLFTDLKATDSIISFNWDTIVDFTLQQAGRPIYRGYLDLMTKEPLRVRDYRNRPVLLKLHGSLNWLVCRNRECSLFGKPLLAVKGKKLQRLIHMFKCPACGDEREPFIVPPTSQKFIRRGTLLHKLWLIARNKLPMYKRMIFVGYSFPATDFYSEWLFRQIHFMDDQLPVIIIVNPAAMKKRSQVSQRYDRLFRGCEVHRFASLEDFSRNGRGLLLDD
jgi:hypothetical protein